MSEKNRNEDEGADQTLVEALMKGDQTRFDDLYARYHGRVYGFALRRVGNPSDAEDITQEVFLQVHRSLASYQGRARLATWIFGIAHNVTCRHFRSRGAVGSVPLDSCEASARLTVVPFAERQIDAARTVDRCTDMLGRARTPEHLEIFRLFYGLGRPLRAIAGATGKPTDSVKDSLRRSRNLLRRDVPDIRSALAAAGATTAF